MDTFTTEVLINTTYFALKGLECFSYRNAGKGCNIMNGTAAGLSRSKRFVKPLLGGIAAAIALAPVLKADFCHYFSFFGLCGLADLDRLGKETEFLDGAVKTIALESGERIHLLGYSLNKTQVQLTMISHNSTSIKSGMFW